MLRGLVIEDVLEQDDHGRFALGTLGAALIALRAPALARGEIYYGPAASLLECVLEGGTPYERATGDRFFDHLHRHPELEAVFHAGMAGRAEQEAADVVASFDFSGFSRLMDVGGGRGVLLAAILTAAPTMTGVLVDREVALGQARTFLDEAGVGDRTECLPVDFFESVPGGADAYLLSRVLHDWDDADALRILARHAGRPCPPMLGSSSWRPSCPSARWDRPFAVLMDVHMLLLLGARERTQAEFRDLLERGGFQMEGVASTGSPAGLAVIEASPT